MDCNVQLSKSHEKHYTTLYRPIHYCRRVWFGIDIFHLYFMIEMPNKMVLWQWVKLNIFIILYKSPIDESNMKLTEIFHP